MSTDFDDLLPSSATNLAASYYDLPDETSNPFADLPPSSVGSSHYYSQPQDPSALESVPEDDSTPVATEPPPLSPPGSPLAIRRPLHSRSPSSSRSIPTSSAAPTTSSPTYERSQHSFSAANEDSAFASPNLNERYDPFSSAISIASTSSAGPVTPKYDRVVVSPLDVGLIGAPTHSILDGPTEFPLGDGNEAERSTSTIDAGRTGGRGGLGNEQATGNMPKSPKTDRPAVKSGGALFGEDVDIDPIKVRGPWKAIIAPKKETLVLPPKKEIVVIPVSQEEPTDGDHDAQDAQSVVTTALNIERDADAMSIGSGVTSIAVPVIDIRTEVLHPFPQSVSPPHLSSTPASVSPIYPSTPNFSQTPSEAGASEVEPSPWQEPHSPEDGDTPRLPSASEDLPTATTAVAALPTDDRDQSPAQQPTFVITVGDPQKVGADLGGGVGGAHTVYTVRTKTTSNVFRRPEFSVLRRFRDFLWLYDALTNNNPGVIVPPVPEKHALGRFSSEFVEQRRLALQQCLQRVCNHPLLVSDPDLRLFLESDSFSMDIKHRRADLPEKAGFLASLSNTISGPKFSEFDEYFDSKRHYLDSLESQLKALHSSFVTVSKSRAALSNSVAELSTSLVYLSECHAVLSRPLRNAISSLAALEKKVRDFEDEQARTDDSGIIACVEGYSRLVGSIRVTMSARVKAYHTWQAAEAIVRKVKMNHEKAKRQGRAYVEIVGHTLAEIADAERKCDDSRRDFEDISKLIKAEMIRFDKEKVDDFRASIQQHVNDMLRRQREVVKGWQDYNDLLQRITAIGANPPASSSGAQGPANPQPQPTD